MKSYDKDVLLDIDISSSRVSHNHGRVNDLPSLVV